MKTLKKELASWYGFHGYMSFKDMPGEMGITESFRLTTPIFKKPITFNFSHVISDAHGNPHAFLFEGDAPEGYLVSITIANDLGNS